MGVIRGDTGSLDYSSFYDGYYDPKATFVE